MTKELLIFGKQTIPTVFEKLNEMKELMIKVFYRIRNQCICIFEPSFWEIASKIMNKLGFAINGVEDYIVHYTNTDSLYAEKNIGQFWNKKG